MDIQDWSKLSMRDRAKFIRSSVANGLKNIDSIRLAYNLLKEGGPKKLSTYSINKAEFLKLLDLSLRNYAHTAFDNPQMRRFFTELADKESTFSPTAMHKSGAKGYFLLMPFNRPDNWSTPIQQFDDMYRLTRANMRHLRKELTLNDLKKAAELGIDIYGILAGAHLGGVRGVLDALREKKNAADANGSTVLGYMKQFSLNNSENPVVLHNIENKWEKIVYPPNNPVDTSKPNVQPVFEQALLNNIPIKETILPEVTIEAQRQPQPQIQPLKNKLVAPWQLPSFHLAQQVYLDEPVYQKPINIVEDIKNRNAAYASLLNEELQNSILRNITLGEEIDLDKLKKDILDLQAYENFAANGGPIAKKSNMFQTGGAAYKDSISTLNSIEDILKFYQDGYKLPSEYDNACARFANDLFDRLGYNAYNDAWQPNDASIIFNGYTYKTPETSIIVASKPERFNKDALIKRNQDASYNVLRHFDRNILDPTLPYQVNMYYSNSPNLEKAYYGNKGYTGTHTGIALFDPSIEDWIVLHNSGGTVHKLLLKDLQGKDKTYGITAITLPNKYSTIDKIKKFIRGRHENGGLLYENGGKLTDKLYFHVGNKRTFKENLYDDGGKTFISELDWSPDSWFSKRVAKPDGTYYNAEEAKRLASHVSEYHNIEKTAKQNGTWLKMPDGSTWDGDPRSWVMMQSEAYKKNYSQKPWYTGQAEWSTTFDYPNDSQGAIKTNKMTRAPYYNGQMWFSNDKSYGDAFAYLYKSNGIGYRRSAPREQNIWGHNFLAAIPKKGTYRLLASPKEGTSDNWEYMPYVLKDNHIYRLPNSQIDTKTATKGIYNKRKDGKKVLTDDVVNWSKDLRDSGIFLHKVSDGSGIEFANPDVMHRFNSNQPVKKSEFKFTYPILEEFISQPGFTNKVKFIEGNTGDFDIDNPYKYAKNVFNKNTLLNNNFASLGGLIYNIKKKTYEGNLYEGTTMPTLQMNTYIPLWILNLIKNKK